MRISHVKININPWVFSSLCLGQGWFGARKQLAVATWGFLKLPRDPLPTWADPSWLVPSGVILTVLALPRLQDLLHCFSIRLWRQKQNTSNSAQHPALWSTVANARWPSREWGCGPYSPLTHAHTSNWDNLERIPALLVTINSVRPTTKARLRDGRKEMIFIRNEPSNLIISAKNLLSVKTYSCWKMIAPISHSSSPEKSPLISKYQSHLERTVPVWENCSVTTNGWIRSIGSRTQCSKFLPVMMF